jgi:hypothetical protein
MGRFLSPADYTHDELNKTYPPGEEPVSRQIGGVAREFVCGLYETYPGGLLRMLGDSSLALSGRQTLLDKMCRPINRLPPAPAQQFVGGQCPGFAHLVRVNTTRLGVLSDNSVSPSLEQLSVDVFAPIYDVKLTGLNILTAGASSIKAFQGITVYASAIDANGKPYPYAYARNKYVDSPNAGTGDIRDISVDANPSDPMNCDAQKPKYPEKPIPLVSITNNVNITVAPTLTVSVPVTIIPTLIAPVFGSVRPEINVKVGDLVVNFAPDGVRITDPSPTPIAPNLNYDPRIVPPDTINVDDSTQSSTPVDLTPVLTVLATLKQEILDCCERDAPFMPPDAARLITTVLGSGESGFFNLPPNTFRVGLVITDRPIKVKLQEGFIAPNVLYAGWAWFGSGVGMSERMPVDSEQKMYSPPRYVSNAFGFTLYEGLTATITAYSTRPKPSTP